MPTTRELAEYNTPAGLKKDVENSKKDVKSVDKLQMKVSVIDASFGSLRTIREVLSRPKG